MVDPLRALSFGQAAAHYDRVRPSYPAEAVAWALGDPTGPLRVVDLGAGTGLLTRVLVGLAHDVVPVEPDEGMRAQLARSTPGVAALAGSAESIPLADASVDAIVAGQAYHWFDRRRAHAEIARVLRVGGFFAAMWNIRDESVAWVAELSRAAALRDGGDEASSVDRVADLGPGFEPVELRAFHHATPHTADSLVDLVKSRSYYLTAAPDLRKRLETAVRHLATTHPTLRNCPHFPLPYRTDVFRTRRTEILDA